ncbi:Protein-tyrosine-phosphatase IBR5 [Sesamum angolense]|uniref:Protein-tyrosine-phosphatase IBR5 n=1 Tax=Sesamum angolense TaxID=2727404 RepID=A0AAE1VXS1_9LAMI|nr:Protein-tyrosine-phosphatase IBR5 [Sesamum angolense]
MRKRERENPCGVCGHYHKYEEGEVCGVCGHRMPAVSDKSAASSVQFSAFPSEILPEFLYLGSYDNAARAELLKTQGITRVLNLKHFSIRFISFNLSCLVSDLPFFGFFLFYWGGEVNFREQGGSEKGTIPETSMLNLHAAYWLFVEETSGKDLTWVKGRIVVIIDISIRDFCRIRSSGGHGFENVAFTELELLGTLLRSLELLE